MVDEFDSEAEALACVRGLIEGMPANAAESLLLGIVRDDGRRETVATGDELRDRAMAARSTP
jgi:hypothetical protein